MLNNKPYEIVSTNTNGNQTLKNLETGEYIDTNNKQIIKQLQIDKQWQQ